METKSLPIDVIDEPTSAMRTEIPRDAVFDLMADIKKNGLINPITVRPRGGRYEVVAGHRRFLAHRYGGIAKIDCIVRDLSDEDAFALMTSENLAREDVNPVDEAIHCGRLLEMFGGEIGRVAAITGRSTQWVTDRVSISQMADDLKGALREGKLKLGVALALHRIKDDVDRGTCLQSALLHGASVTMAQYYAAQWEAGLFGHRIGQSNVPGDFPETPPRIVMLRCAVDGKEYPATDFTSILVHRDNVGYITALREHLKLESPASNSGGGDGMPGTGDPRGSAVDGIGTGRGSATTPLQEATHGSAAMSV